jgi:anaerobic dimethyl sulfoxide reductase subunit C (anchor subunit)
MGEHDRSEWSLVFFTILTQLAVGVFILRGLIAGLLPPPNALTTGLFPRVLLGTALISLVLGALAASTHLGRPVGAVFSLSNWRSSWLSREALLAAGFGVIVLAAFILRLLGFDFGWADRLVIFIGCVSGISLVFGISRLYRLRTVPAWDNGGTIFSFFTTCLLTGTLAVLSIWLLLVGKESALASYMYKEQVVEISSVLIFLLVGMQAGGFGFQMIFLSQLGGAGAESVQILWRKLRGVLIVRWSAALAGVALVIVGESAPLLLLACFLLFVSEILGRFLFYAAYQRVGY